MSITFVHTDESVQYANSATSVSITIDNSVATGDMIVIPYFCRSTGTPPSGFTKHAENIFGGTFGGRTGFYVKLSDGTEGGTSVTVSQASAGRIEAFHSIFRGSSLAVSDSTIVDADTSSTVTLPTITESVAFLSLSAVANEYAAESTQVLFNFSASADAEWNRLNTVDPRSDAIAGRMWAGYAIYLGADTSLVEWEYTPAYTATQDAGASMISVVEGAAAAVSFSGTVPTLNGAVSTAFSEALSSYFSGTETPFVYSLQSGALPGGLSLNTSTGVISGTPTTAGTQAGIVVRATDQNADTADTNSFSIDIAAEPIDSEFSVTIDPVAIGSTGGNNVPSAQSNFPVFVDLSDMPATFWANVSDGGGDIRCYASDGTTELAREVVSCDTATNTGELHVKVPSLSASVDTEIIVKVDGARIDYAATDTYGRNAVWSDYVFVFHGGDGVDSAGNSANLTARGTATFGATGQLGEAMASPSGTSNDLGVGSSGITALTTSTVLTAQMWVYRDADKTSDFFEELYLSVEGADGFFVGADSEQQLTLYTDGANTSSRGDGATLPLLAWKKFDVTWDQPSQTAGHYIDGLLDGAVVTGYTNTSANSNPDIVIGNSDKYPGDGMDGRIDEVRLRYSALSADWLAAEYNNQKNPNGFYTISEVGASTPSLTSPEATPTGATTADLSVTTNQDNGTLYWIVSTSATPPSVAQIQAGNDSTGSAAADSGSQAVSATGAQNASSTGLTSGTTHYAHFQHQNATSDDSGVVTSAAFTPGVEMVATADNFDSAIGTSHVTNATTTTPDITITPFDPSEVPGWMMTYTRYTGCNGKTPEFTLGFTDYRGGISIPSSPWQMVWRYVDDTAPGTGRPRAWNTFDNNAGDPSHVFSNSAAFSQDVVEVAVKPRWRYLDTQRAFAYVESTGLAVELPSSIAASGLPKHVHDQFTHGGTTSNTAPAIAINMYGCGVDDTSVQPAGGDDKLNLIMIPGQHASEDQGNDSCWEAVYFYTDGVGTVADWFRQHCRLFVYDANPQGRYYGRERWTDETASDEDPNRAWDDSGSEQISAVKTAIGLDISRTDILWDWHGDYRLNGNGITSELGIFQTYATEGTWRTRVNTLLSPVVVADLGTAPAGSAQDYGNGTLSAQLSSTLEFPIAYTNYPNPQTAYSPVVTAYVEAVKEMVAASELTLTSGNLAASATATSTATGALTTAITFAADSTATSSATGDLLTAITMASDATANGTATGALTTAITLASDATATATATGDLLTQSTFAGDATATSTATGDLSTAITLAADATATSTATGALQADSGTMAANATASATSSGSLTTQITMAAGASATTITTGDLATAIVLNGAASASGTATGDLLTEITLAANATATATATGTMAGQVLLAPGKQIFLEAGTYFFEASPGTYFFEAGP